MHVKCNIGCWALRGSDQLQLLRRVSDATSGEPVNSQLVQLEPSQTRQYDLTYPVGCCEACGEVNQADEYLAYRQFFAATEFIWSGNRSVVLQ
jgi:hypothetical protein